MTPKEIEKIINDTKELLDIKKEYNKTEKLLKEQKWEELQKHIQDVISKYPLEAIIYNTVNRNMPTNIQENAQNCMNFLNGLLMGKLALKINELSK